MTRRAAKTLFLFILILSQITFIPLSSTPVAAETDTSISAFDWPSWPDWDDLDPEEFAQEVVDAIWEKIKKIPEMVVDEIGNTLGDSWGMIKDIPGTLDEYVIHPISDFFLSIPDAAVGFVTDSIDSITDMISGYGEWVESVLPASMMFLAPILGSAYFVAAIILIAIFLTLYQHVPVIG